MNVEELNDSRSYLARIAVWPRHVDIRGWLSNFDEGPDRLLAMHMLDSLVHLNEDQITHAVASTIREISSTPEFGDTDARPQAWLDFLSTALVSFPLSRSGDATASGYIFARLAKALGFAERQILGPEDTLERLSSTGPLPLILLDDLAASGTQFCRNWVRNYGTGKAKVSFESLQERGLVGAAYYLPIVSTAAATSGIEATCHIHVIPAYTLDEDYCALASNTRLVPEGLRPSVPAFLAKYSVRSGRDEYGVAGYGDLGLALSFHHGSPNNTVPILQWGGAATNGWKRLFT